MSIVDLGSSPFGTKTASFLSSLNYAPIVYPDGSVYQHKYQHVQSGLIGIQPLESFLNLLIGIGGELLYGKRRETTDVGLPGMKVLADDGVEGGAWDVTLGDRRRCFALGYEVTPSYAWLPEGQLLAGLPWPERVVFLRQWTSFRK